MTTSAQPPADPTGVNTADAASGAAHRLLEQVYRELREIAAQRLRTMSPNDSLHPTELLHEAYLRLTSSRNRDFESKQHFIGASAMAMRSILVDRARRRMAVKHGGAMQRLGQDVGDLPLAIEHTDAEVVELDAALQRLEAVDARAAKVVTLRFFLGLGDAEIGEALGITDRTVRRDWNFARLWLRRDLGAQPPGESGS